jgi:hypothetical protein
MKDQVKAQIKNKLNVHLLSHTLTLHRAASHFTYFTTMVPELQQNQEG